MRFLQQSTGAVMQAANLFPCPSNFFYLYWSTAVCCHCISFTIQGIYINSGSSQRWRTGHMSTFSTFYSFTSWKVNPIWCIKNSHWDWTAPHNVESCARINLGRIAMHYWRVPWVSPGSIQNRQRKNEMGICSTMILCSVTQMRLRHRIYWCLLLQDCREGMKEINAKPELWCMGLQEVQKVETYKWWLQLFSVFRTPALLRQQLFQTRNRKKEAAKRTVFFTWITSLWSFQCFISLNCVQKEIPH